MKAKLYSTRAYDLDRFKPAPNYLILDTQGWVLTLCGGDDAVEGLNILRQMIVDRDDTRTFIEGRYHLGEAYLRMPVPSVASARKWLMEAMGLIVGDEKAGRPVDPDLKAKIESSLSRLRGPSASDK